MQGLNRAICEFNLAAVQKATCAFKNAEIRELLTKAESYGKGDTLGLDATPEITYSEEIGEFDTRAVYITEETDDKIAHCMPLSCDPVIQPLICVSDPLDRSKPLSQFTSHVFTEVTGQKDFGESDMTLQDLWSKIDVVEKWEEFFKEAPATITGATTSLTCVYRGEVICSVVSNIVTGKMTLSCELGVFSVDLKEKENTRLLLEDVCNNSERILFPKLQTPTPSLSGNGVSKKFVTFLGKKDYPEHFNASKILLGQNCIEKYIHHSNPGGPSRVFFLSSLNDGHDQIGFILANGEKITEFIHWLATVKFARDAENRRVLRIFEVYTPERMEKAGMRMSVNPNLSIFRDDPRLGKFMDVNRLGLLTNPSHYRSMIVVCHESNTWMTTSMKQKGYREISEYF